MSGLGLGLSEHEVARAARYRIETRRRRFVAARGLLRVLLGRYLDRDPASLRFVYGAQGKPALGDAGPGLSFNVTHSGDRALFAVARGRPLGVDLEAIDAGMDHDAIAQRFFAPGLAAELRSLSAQDRVAAFFCRWVRQEAYAKALGVGLYDRAFEEPAESAEGFQLEDLAPCPGYAAALAMPGTASLRCFTLA